MNIRDFVPDRDLGSTLLNYRVDLPPRNSVRGAPYACPPALKF